MDSTHVHVVCFANTHSFDSYLYGGWHYPLFPQLVQGIFESGTHYKNTYKLGSGHLIEGTLTCTGCTMQNAKTNDYSLTYSSYLILSSCGGMPSSFSMRFRSCLNVVFMASVSIDCFPSDVDRRTFLSLRFTTGCVAPVLLGLV